VLPARVRNAAVPPSEEGRACLFLFSLPLVVLRPARGVDAATRSEARSSHGAQVSRLDVAARDMRRAHGPGGSSWPADVA